jgi:hypothetical protein
VKTRQSLAKAQRREEWVNSKHEIRNSKQIQNDRFEFSKFGVYLAAVCFEIRISDLASLPDLFYG